MARDWLAGVAPGPIHRESRPSDSPGRDPVRPRRLKCPECGTPTMWQDNPHRPFCSLRCRLADLGQWLDERYRLPGPAFSPEADDVP
ncbi:MAG TPA: DNA gyrase inhibitor YacG [Actinomycetota bacterium]